MRTTAHRLSSGREKEGVGTSATLPPRTELCAPGAALPTLMLPAKDLRMRSMIIHHYRRQQGLAAFTALTAQT
eukprot:scaffold100031_cov72-Phaeocystis_antarctica.AAC.3